MLDVFSIGTCHSRSSADERSKYALTVEQQMRLYSLVLQTDYTPCFILNTCNRTEIYGIGNADKVIEAYGEVLGKQNIVSQSINRITGKDAVYHIIKVACGLDSQVIGDLEILGQFKSAFHFSKQNNASNGYMERLANTAIQAAKETRSKTNISSGTVSLSYAAIKYIKRQVQTPNMNILVVGTGDFGKRIANNIKEYLPDATLTLSNRTASKAEELAMKLKCKTKAFENLSDAIAENDVIISSVNDAKNYLINDKNTTFGLVKGKIFVDMSIPCSIDPNLAYSGHTLVNIDEISKEINQTIESRMQDIPVALQIIDKYVQEFLDWAAIFEKSESIRQWKKMMTQLSHTCPHLNRMAEEDKNRIVERSLADFAVYVKQRGNLPNEAEQIIQHFLIESDKAIACQKAAITQHELSIINCSACQST